MRSSGVRLDIDGASDVSAAIDQAARRAGGPVTVTRAGGFFLEAESSDAGSVGLLSLASGDERKGQRQYATAPVTPAEAKALFADFLNGGDAWRRQCRWRSRDTPAAAPSGKRSSGSFADWAAGAGAIAFMLGAVYVPWLVPAAAALALCGFVVWKSWQEVRVRRWPLAYGNIVASGLQPRRQRFRREATRLDNIPALRYTFPVAGRHYVGTRLGLNTAYAGVDVGALVARYPVGAIVRVSYNPANPNECLLDPFGNRGLAGEALRLVAILGVFGAGLWYGASAATVAVAARFPNANAGHVVFASGGGVLFLLLFVWSFRPRTRAAPPPRAAGAIVRSEVEEIAHDRTGSNLLGGTTYLQPTIEVAYTIGGQHYILRTAIGAWVAATTPEVAQARILEYPIGKTVNICYDPSNPGGSWLEANPSVLANDSTPTRYRVLALACAVACFAMATVALGIY